MPAERLVSSTSSTARKPEGDVVGIVGAGPVGLVTAAVLAGFGHEVTIVERDLERFAALKEGRAPFFEPGLDSLVGEATAAGLLRPSDKLCDLAEAPVVFVCVGTPPQEDGRPDLSDLDAALDGLLPVLRAGAILVIKSTVPPGTADRTRAVASRSRPDIGIVSCPEFLREGNAIYDMRAPDRIVVGGPHEQARVVADLFAKCDAPVVLTSSASAELIKYGANAFLATKISFINELANLCEMVGADVTEVADGIGADSRIGRAFLDAGLGFGGSCFPKDLRGLEEAAAVHGYTSWLLKACTEINSQQRHRFVRKIRDAVGGSLAGKRIAVLGLAFKPGTDDIRQSPAIDVIYHLEAQGATVLATDPVATSRARDELRSTTILDEPYACLEDADALVLATAWPEYVELSWEKVFELMRSPVVIDGRNALDSDRLLRLGFVCHGVGRALRRA